MTLDSVLNRQTAGWRLKRTKRQYIQTTSPGCARPSPRRADVDVLDRIYRGRLCIIKHLCLKLGQRLPSLGRGPQFLAANFGGTP